jgi:hypothetical protein
MMQLQVLDRPSTIAAGWPKAIEAMAPAVYGPTPGTLRRSGTAAAGERRRRRQLDIPVPGRVPP